MNVTQHARRRVLGLRVDGCLVSVVAVVVVLAALVVVASIRSVDERWPAGRTPLVRESAEKLLPPPADVEFATVVILASFEHAYSECVYYRTDASVAGIVNYYATILRSRGWRVSEGPQASGLYATPAPDAGPQVWVFSSSSPPPAPSPQSAAGGKETIAICSSSWEAALRASGGTNPPNSV